MQKFKLTASLRSLLSVDLRLECGREFDQRDTPNRPEAVCPNTGATSHSRPVDQRNESGEGLLVNVVQVSKCIAATSHPRQQRFKLLRWQRRAEQMALVFVTAHDGQQVALRFGFRTCHRDC
jgi:hypothetical protein